MCRLGLTYSKTFRTVSNFLYFASDTIEGADIGHDVW
jgi:hypothetical protein